MGCRGGAAGQCTRAAAGVESRTAGRPL